jgi:hypothetical protein
MQLRQTGKANQTELAVVKYVRQKRRQKGRLKLHYYKAARLVDIICSKSKLFHALLDPLFPRRLRDEELSLAQYRF